MFLFISKYNKSTYGECLVDPFNAKSFFVYQSSKNYIFYKKILIHFLK